MTDISLLAIVEVEKADRVICRAPRCGHSVYRRIHVVKMAGQVSVLGSSCFKKLCGDKPDTQPHYKVANGRTLTPEERRLLLENTESLIKQFEAESQAITAKKQRPPPLTLQPPRFTSPAITAQERARREAAREAWQIDQQRLRQGMSTPPAPDSTEWADWSESDWSEWAQNRMAGKAQWIDTPEAMAAWKALVRDGEH